MTFGGFSCGQASRPVAEINMIPFIDVMLVLLVIFIVTAPLLTHAVKIDLPQASSTANMPEPDSVQLSLDAAGQAYWNGQAVTREELRARMAGAASAAQQPELQIRADGELRYKAMAEIMADAARTGLTRLVFVSDPRATP